LPPLPSWALRRRRHSPRTHPESLGIGTGHGDTPGRNEADGCESLRVGFFWRVGIERDVDEHIVGLDSHLLHAKIALLERSPELVFPQPCELESQHAVIPLHGL